MNDVEMLKADLSRLEKEREIVRLRVACYRAIERVEAVFEEIQY